MYLLKRIRTREPSVAIENSYEKIVYDLFDIILNSSYITFRDFTISKIINYSVKLLILYSIKMSIKEKTAVAIAKIVKAIPTQLDIENFKVNNIEFKFEIILYKNYFSHFVI